MDPLLLDIGKFLEDNGIVEEGITYFSDFVPEEPDELIACTEYAGEPTLFVDSAVHRSVQLLVRSKNYLLAKEKAIDAFEAFRFNQSEDGRVQLTDTKWCQLYLRQPPFKFKMDQNNRVYYAFNLGITTTIE